MRLFFLLTLFCLVAATSVFDKYIELKRSLKEASLPAQEVVPPPPPPTGVDHDTGKTEEDMRAAMLAKPSNHTGKKKNNYASGHTFLPNVHRNITWHVSTKTSNHTSQTPPTRQPETVVQEQTNETLHKHVHSEVMYEAVVGQGGRTGVNNHIEETRSKTAWSGFEVVPAALLGALIWGCILALRKTGARRKARVLKKRLTMPRLMA